jgi:16S rRNA (cytosine967-C5)-methyltransferase
MEVSELPGFGDGLISVQDQAAQLCANLLNPQAGERVLDACAAPGGKTAHLLEVCPELELTALDISAKRLVKVEENLQRLGLTARIRQGDARQLGDWWDQQPVDRILLDAPCSATGVIRRHPDIKLLRRADDIKKLVETQAQMLSTLWPLLKTGGMLLYSTCSILAEENDQQIQRFIQNNDDAREQPIHAEWGHARPVGRQILPGEDDMDGFYYALIYKTG